METRKIIQIAVTYDHGENGAYRPGDSVYALCSDASVWVMGMPMGEHCKWGKLPDIPQPEPRPDPLSFRPEGH